MKRYFLALIFALFCLPSVSFAQKEHVYGPILDRGVNPKYLVDRPAHIEGQRGSQLPKQLSTNRSRGKKINWEPFRSNTQYIQMCAIEQTIDETTGLTTLRWENGMSYTGEIYRSQLHGMGTMIYPDSSQYQGQWVFSIRRGAGTIVYPDGSMYSGSWKGDIPNGEGTYQTPEGIAYSVNFENGVPHGKGIIQDVDGRQYKGRWVHGVLKEKSIKLLKK